MNHNKIASPYILYTLLIILFISCGNRNTLFHEYVAINNEEWYYDDSLHFEIDSVVTGGNLTTILEFRANAKYPYRNISIVMEQSLRNGNKHTQKTIAYEIIDSKGRKNGEGITYITHQVPFCTMNVNTGDTIDINIKHNMQDNMLPGITDVGVLIENNDD